MRIEDLAPRVCCVDMTPQPASLGTDWVAGGKDRSTATAIGMAELPAKPMKKSYTISLTPALRSDVVLSGTQHRNVL